MNFIGQESSTAAYLSEDAQNHRKRFAEVLPDDEPSAREDDIPIGFRMKNYSAGRIIFPDEGAMAVGSASGMNSIRDILDQVDDGTNIPHESAIPPRGRGIRIAGTYRRYKQFDPPDTLATMQSMTHAQQVPATNTGYGQRKRPKDPFSKFRPTSMSDVNLLALNQVRFAPYTHNTPRPLLRLPADDAKQKPFDYANQNLAESMYNQILWASNNRLKTTAVPMNSRNEHVPKKQKPFSLMLDVYPMPSSDEEPAPVSSTRHTPHTNRPPRPIYPMPIDAHSINHNLQYANDNSYYNQMKFPQLQPYHQHHHRIPIDASSAATSHVNGPNPNYYLYRNYMPKRQNVYPTNQLRRPPPVYDAVLPPSDDAPSQITVHLNLFPNKPKKAKSSPTSRMRSVQILDSGHLGNTAPSEDRFYNRRMEYEHVADNARVRTPLMTSSAASADSNNNYDEMPFRPLKSPTITPNWLLPHFDEDVKSTNISIGESIAEDTSPFHSSESIEFDATTNYENIQNANTAKPILGNRSMAAVTASGRLFLPELTQSDAFSKSSSAQPVRIDDVNGTSLSTKQQQQQQWSQQQFPMLIRTTAITDAANDELMPMRPITFPQN